MSPAIRVLATFVLKNKALRSTSKEMGFWKGVHNVVTLGGAHRLDKAKERYEACHLIYEQTVSQLTVANASLEATIKRLRRSFGRTKKKLRTAHKMLYPKCLGAMQVQEANYSQSQPVGTTALAVSNRRKSLDLSAGEYTALGVTAGTSAAIIAWQGVQVLGIASTGTAIGGIYGAAASNAGWAAFGGGSLAAGGGGMALGHLMLPGIGLLVAVGVGAISTHSKANELNRISDQLDSATEKNEATLARIDCESERLYRATTLFATADSTLRREIRKAHWKLRRFGWISVCYRYLRFKINGVYYTSAEQDSLYQLERAINQFMTTFGAR